MRLDHLLSKDFYFFTITMLPVSYLLILITPTTRGYTCELELVKLFCLLPFNACYVTMSAWTSSSVG